MNLRIADSFVQSLTRLSADDQKAVKTTVFDLQVNPAHPGLKFHRIDRSKDPDFWSVRASSDVRIVVHRKGGEILVCYADHHDAAYSWAERRRLEVHPRTNAVQIVEIRETVREVTIPRYVDAVEVVAPLANIDTELLHRLGVPADWVNDLKAADEDTLLEIADHLPAEAAETVLRLAAGERVVPAMQGAPTDPYDHPDTLRRVRLMQTPEELSRALDAPWASWSVFLHPDQKTLVEREYTGPARISGSAGTGKTIVALHRTAYLARTRPDVRILLTTFSPRLADDLQHRLRLLLGNDPRAAERVDVETLASVARRLVAASAGIAVDLVADDELETLIGTVHQNAGQLPVRISPAFLIDEWLNVVDAWNVKSWEDYREVPRVGRRTRLSEQQREDVWGLLEKVREELAGRQKTTESGVLYALAEEFRSRKHPPYDFVVVDEAQDVSVAQLSLLSVFRTARPDALFFTGDIGQQIFQHPFSWRALGIDLRGNSYTLRVNYRTSHQIRTSADHLLDKKVSDADGDEQNRADTVSIFNGPAPEIRLQSDQDEETEAVATWCRELIEEGFAPAEIAVIVRSRGQLSRAQAVHEKLADADRPSIAIATLTMHDAKGLEFRAVAVMACDDDVIPDEERIAAVADAADLEAVYNTERHLLYVACTRARDRLLVTGVEPGSEFLEDLSG